jgi:hypothetical protein
VHGCEETIAGVGGQKKMPAGDEAVQRKARESSDERRPEIWTSGCARRCSAGFGTARRREMPKAEVL